MSPCCQAFQNMEVFGEMYMEYEPISRCGERLKRETEHLYELYERFHRAAAELREDEESKDAADGLRIPEQQLLEICTELMKMYAGLEKISGLFRQTEYHLVQVFQGEEKPVSGKKIERPVWKELIESEKIRRMLELEQKGDEANEGTS